MDIPQLREELNKLKERGKKATPPVTNITLNLQTTQFEGQATRYDTAEKSTFGDKERTAALQEATNIVARLRSAVEKAESSATTSPPTKVTSPTTVPTTTGSNPSPKGATVPKPTVSDTSKGGTVKPITSTASPKITSPSKPGNVTGSGSTPTIKPSTGGGSVPLVPKKIEWIEDVLEETVIALPFKPKGSVGGETGGKKLSDSGKGTSGVTPQPIVKPVSVSTPKSGTPVTETVTGPSSVSKPETTKVPTSATTGTAKSSSSTSEPTTLQEVVKQKNVALKKAVDTLQEEIKLANPTRKAEIANEAVLKVTNLSADKLEKMSAQDQIQLLLKLTCSKDSNGKVFEQQRKALAKVYGSIRLDKDFREHDDEMRKGILDAVTQDETVKNGRADWNKTTALTETKKNVLRKVQELQVGKLGFVPDTMVFGDISDGSSGVCSGKTVKISTKDEHQVSFDEVLNTVIHETTHAYQRHLEELLDAGKLKEDDKRYAQAWLFKLNDEAYAKPPTTLTEHQKSIPGKQEAYDADYLAYKRQPLEEHAWKAGDEAGRAFDANAIALEVGDIVSNISSLVPGKATEANSLIKKVQEAGSIREKAEVMEELDALAVEAFKASSAKARRLFASVGNYVTNGFEIYSEECYAIEKSKDNARVKLKKMNALAKTLEEKTKEGKDDQKAYDEAEKESRELLNSIGTYVVGGAPIYQEKFNACRKLTAYKARATAMIDLRDEMRKAIDEGKAAKDVFEKASTAAQQLSQELETLLKGAGDLYEKQRKTITGNAKTSFQEKSVAMAKLEKQLTTEVANEENKKYETAKAGAEKLYPGIGEYVVGGYERYSKEWLEIAKSKDPMKDRQSRMTALWETLKRETEEGKVAKSSYDNAAQGAKLLCKGIGTYIAGGTESYTEQINKIEKSTAPLKERAALMTSLWEKLKQETAEGSLAKTNYDKAALGAKPLCTTIGQYIPGATETYTKKFQEIENRKVTLKEKAAAMTSLFETLNGETEEGKKAKAAYDIASAEAKNLYPEIGAYVPGGAEFYGKQWKEIDDSKVPLTEKAVKMRALSEVLKLETDKGEKAQYEKAKAGATDLYPGIGTYVIGGYELYSNQWQVIADSKVSMKQKAAKMTALWETLTKETEEGKIALAKYKEADAGAKSLIPSIGTYVTGGFDTYNKQWTTIANSNNSLKERAESMTALWETLTKETEEGKIALAKYKEADAGAKSLISSIGTYVTGGFDTYNKQWTTIANSNNSLKERAESMTALWKTLKEKKSAAEAGVAAFDDFWSKMKCTTQAEVDEANKINKLNISSPDKYKQIMSSLLLANVRKNVGL